MKTSLPVIALALVVWTGCHSPAPSAESVQPTAAVVDTTAIQQAVRASFDASTDGWNKGDIVAYMGSYEQSDSLRTVDGDRAYFGWQRGVDSWLASDPNGEQMGTAYTDEATVEVLGAESALLYNRWHIVHEGDTMTGASTMVFRKQAPGWRIVHSHTSYGS